MNRTMFLSFIGVLTCGAAHGTSSHEPPCSDGAQDERCRAFLGSNGTSFLQAKSVLGRTGLMESSDSVETPSDVMDCPAGAVSTTVSMTQAKYHAVAKSVTELLLGLSSRCTVSECPRADWAGCVLRLAGHDFMDFNNGVGGSDACTDMNHIDNTGLAPCLHEGEHGVSLSDAYVQHCADVSLADFIVIAAEAIMEASRPGSSLNFHATFRYGRTTNFDCVGAAELLPNPSRGCPAVEETFVNRMGLSWRSAAALMGVHSLGRAKIGNSGFHGWWSDPINSRLFNNNYFVSLLSKGWVPETSVDGRTVKSQWGRSDAQRDSSFDGHEMMLDTDLCLAFAEEGPNRREHTPVLSSIHDCCAWVNFAVGGARCGNRRQCCGQRNADDCGRPGNPSGPAAAHVLEFGNNEQAWIQEFKTAWTRATENGAQGLKSLEPGTPSTPTTPTIAPAPTPIPASTPEPTTRGRKGGNGRGRKGR